MSARRGGRVWPALWAALGLVTGCGTILDLQNFYGEVSSDSGVGDGHSAPESGVDARSASGLDARSEIKMGSDGRVDSGFQSESASDSEVDSGSRSESGPNSGIDTGSGSEAGSDSGADSGSDAEESRDSTADASDAGCSTTPNSGEGGTLNWASNFGVTGSTTTSGVAIDPTSADVVVTGSFTGATNFGGGLLTAEGDSSNEGAVFVAKFGSDGGYKWAKAFANADGPAGNNVAIDGSGAVLLAGYLVGTLDFGCGALSAVGLDDIFIVSFDAAGACIWSERFGVAGQSQDIDSLAVDGSGNVLIAGVAYGGLVFGTDPLSGYFIAKFDSTGAPLWSKSFAASSNSSFPTLAVDPSGNIVLAGSFSTTVNFGGGTLTSAGSTDAFVAKFDPSGAYDWAKSYGDDNEQAANTVATDSCGNIFVAGGFGGTIDFGTGILTAHPTVANIFLAKIDPTGNGVWAHSFVGSGTDTFGGGPGTVAVDNSDGAILTCPLIGSVNFGGGALTSAGSGSVSVASFDSAGTYRWAFAGGSPSTANLSGAAEPEGVAAGASVVVAGGFGAVSCDCATSPPGTSLVLDGWTLTAASEEDLFLFSFSP